MQRKSILFIYLLLNICFQLTAQEIVTTADGRKIVIYENHTWEEWKEEKNLKKENIEIYKNQLRPNIKATEIEIKNACEMIFQGWKYKMPMPKSAKAGWGVSDGRTTWWNGYWYNSKTNEYSNRTPRRDEKGLYIGDKQNLSNTWRNGGSPSKPDIYMYLLSDGGGPSF